MPLYEAFTDKYEILEKIGQGGMGAVYRVRHRLLDELRVIKVIRSPLEPTPELTERFLREARTASRLRHPNLALLHDFSMSENGENGDSGVAYLVLEHIDGFTLKEVLRRFGPAPVEVALEIGRQACRALEYLHGRRTVHRDISPSNLMLTRDSEGRPLVKLIDLGLAKSLEAGADGVTTGGVFLGKLRYASPEQLSAEPVDERSDLYSLGIVLYELLTGRSPFKGHDPRSWMADHLFGTPLSFAESDPEGRVPEDLRALLLRAIARSAGERVASAAEFAAALEAIQARYPLAGDEMALLFEPAEPEAAVPEPETEPLEAEPVIVSPATPVEPILFPVAALEAEPEEVTDSLYLVPPSRGSAAKASSPWDVLDDAIGAAPGGGPERPLSRKTSFLPVALPVGVMLVLALFIFLRGRPSLSPQAAETPSAPPPPAATVPPQTPAPAPKTPEIEESVVSGSDGSDRSDRSDVETTVAEEAPQPAPRPAPRREEPQRPKPKPQSRPAPEPERPQPAQPRIAETRLPSPIPVRRTASIAHPARGPMHRGDLIQPGPGVSVPVPLDMPRFSYPAAARGQWTGDLDVRLDLLVDEKGKVVDAVVRDGEPSPLGFNAVALAAARKVPFQPATRNDIPGKMWTEMIFSFSDPAQNGR